MYFWKIVLIFSVSVLSFSSWTMSNQELASDEKTSLTTGNITSVDHIRGQTLRRITKSEKTAVTKLNYLLAEGVMMLVPGDDQKLVLRYREQANCCLIGTPPAIAADTLDSVIETTMLDGCLFLFHNKERAEKILNLFMKLGVMKVKIEESHTFFVDNNGINWGFTQRAQSGDSEVLATRNDKSILVNTYLDIPTITSLLNKYPGIASEGCRFVDLTEKGKFLISE